MQGKKYYPLTYLKKIDLIKPGKLNYTELARQMDRIFPLYEAARVQAAFKFQRLRKISATYAPWLYCQRLPLPILRAIEPPRSLRPDPQTKIYHEIIRKAAELEERLLKTAGLTQMSFFVAAAITAPPILLLSRPKRGHSRSP